MCVRSPEDDSGGDRPGSPANGLEAGARFCVWDELAWGFILTFRVGLTSCIFSLERIRFFSREKNVNRLRKIPGFRLSWILIPCGTSRCEAMAAVRHGKRSPLAGLPVGVLPARGRCVG